MRPSSPSQPPPPPRSPSHPPPPSRSPRHPPPSRSPRHPLPPRSPSHPPPSSQPPQPISYAPQQHSLYPSYPPPPPPFPAQQQVYAAAPPPSFPPQSFPQPAQLPPPLQPQQDEPSLLIVNGFEVARFVCEGPEKVSLSGRIEISQADGYERDPRVWRSLLGRCWLVPVDAKNKEALVRFVQKFLKDRRKAAVLKRLPSGGVAACVAPAEPDENTGACAVYFLKNLGLLSVYVEERAGDMPQLLGTLGYNTNVPAVRVVVPTNGWGGEARSWVSKLDLCDVAVYAVPAVGEALLSLAQRLFDKDRLAKCLRFEDKASVCWLTASRKNTELEIWVTRDRLAHFFPPPSSIAPAPAPVSMDIEKVVDDDQVAADFYNQLGRSHETQADSQIYHLRRFNNWVKMMLITEVWRQATPLGSKTGELAVLDLACGKGGDLAKFLRLKGVTRYVGIDIAESSLEQLADRKSDIDQREAIFQEEFRLVAASLGAKSLKEKGQWRVYEPATKGWTTTTAEEAVKSRDFDVASMQFSMHYMFETKERADTLFKDVASLLRPGGVFLATTVDAASLAALVLTKGRPSEKGLKKGTLNKKWWRADVEDEFYDDALTGLARISERRLHQGPHLRVPLTVWLEDDTRKRLVNADAAGKKEDHGYGLRYWFQLRDGTGANDSMAVDSPEWLAPKHVLESLAEKHGLDLVRYDNFADFLKKTTSENTETTLGSKAKAALKTLKGMNVPDIRGSLSPAEWDIARLYCAVVFKKKPSDMDMVRAMSKVKKLVDERKWKDLTDPAKTAIVRDYVQGGKRWEAFRKVIAQ